MALGVRLDLPIASKSWAYPRLAVQSSLYATNALAHYKGNVAEAKKITDGIQYEYSPQTKLLKDVKTGQIAR
jgi:hypothetical protein